MRIGRSLAENTATVTAFTTTSWERFEPGVFMGRIMETFTRRS